MYSRRILFTAYRFNSQTVDPQCIDFLTESCIVRTYQTLHLWALGPEVLHVWKNFCNNYKLRTDIMKL